MAPEVPLRALTLLCLVACAGQAPSKDDDQANDPSSETCDDPAALPPQQLRLLTRREYDATVRDLLGLSDGGACASDPDCEIAHESCTNDTCVVDPCGRITFQWRGEARTVHVAGPFNGWAPTIAAGGTALTRIAGTDQWYAKVPLDPGEMQYKFVIDEQRWEHDAANPWTTSDGFNGFNSVIRVACDAGSADATPAAPSAGFPPESPPAGYWYDVHAASGLVTTTSVSAQLSASGRLAKQARARLVSLVPCDMSASDCPDLFVRDFARRAFRRPPTEAEVGRLRARFEEGSSFDDGAERMIEAALSSPSFLYRTEIGTQQGGMYRLDPWETASALSYFLWGTMPDDALLAAADDGRLGTRAGVETEARRMLDDPRADAALGAFSRQWLGVERVATADKNPGMFPDWTPTVRAAALRDVEAFFRHVVRDGGVWSSLVTEPLTVSDPVLAPLYGLQATDLAAGPATPPQPRPGVLGLVAVLAGTAHSDQTSPVRRGLFVREHLLCQPAGAPPPNAGGVPAVDPDATTRERFDQHRADPSCNACHRYFDPVGYGFEAYDPVGRYREIDAGKPVDASGVVDDLDRDGGPAVAFTGLDGLSAALATSTDGPACLAREVQRFATGWNEPYGDCGVAALARRFADDGHDLRALIIAVATSESFLYRSAGGTP
jgi:hypothetical protein